MTEEIKWSGAEPGQGSRERQRAETKRKVYEASLAVFRRDGVAASRIEDIVKLAGVSRGTFYFHYPAKDDVLAELLLASERRVAGSFTALPADVPILEVLQATAAAVANEWKDDPRILPDVGMVAMRLTAAGVLTTQTDPLRGALTARFQTAADRGEAMTTLPAYVLADVFLANVFSAAVVWCGMPGWELAPVLHEAVTLFLYGAVGKRLGA